MRRLGLVCGFAAVLLGRSAAVGAGAPVIAVVVHPEVATAAVDADTLFNVGSISKVVTAGAACSTASSPPPLSPSFFSANAAASRQTGDRMVPFAQEEKRSRGLREEVSRACSLRISASAVICPSTVATPCIFCTFAPILKAVTSSRKVYAPRGESGSGLPR